MRYLLKFKKEGYLVYTSHLDVLRLFKRTFKRAGIYLEHSQGFNPHPKMSFAQPLSLGYTGIGECLEFETKEKLETENILAKLNELLPEGISVIECVELNAQGKTMAALVDQAEYLIKVPNVKNFTSEELTEVAESYIEQEEILVKKFQKKSGKEIVVDIKPLIYNIKWVIDNNFIMLRARLAAGSVLNLSPELLIRSFTEYGGIVIERHLIDVSREEIFFRQ